MMAQSFLIAACLGIYATCNWLMTAGADFIIHLLQVLA